MNFPIQQASYQYTTTKLIQSVNSIFQRLDCFDLDPSLVGIPMVERLKNSRALKTGALIIKRTVGKLLIKGQNIEERSGYIHSTQLTFGFVYTATQILDE